MTAEPEFRHPLKDYRPTRRMTREEAIAAVEAGIGSRPDLGPSEVIVRELRDRVWGGFGADA